jgi:hypothetical protein
MPTAVVLWIVICVASCVCAATLLLTWAFSSNPSRPFPRISIPFAVVGASTAFIAALV